MNVLFIHANISNYVTDGLFHGLRQISDHMTVDVPRNDVMYKDANADMLIYTGSGGKTLYGLLDDQVNYATRRNLWRHELEKYDLIIIADIFNCADIFNDLYADKKNRKKLCIVDGGDSTQIFPFVSLRNRLLKKPWTLFYKVNKVPYFKRELTADRGYLGNQRKRTWLSGFISAKFLRRPEQLYSISMSIPAVKIQEIGWEQKEKDWVHYNIDKDLKTLFKQVELTGVGNYKRIFNTEEEYYGELQRSRFGVTTRRGGWDCLRHYEYAANGCILCFKMLDQKPSSCAPFGLNAENCIVYHHEKDLIEKIEMLSNDDLKKMQAKSYQWVKSKTTTNIALGFLSILNIPSKPADQR